MPNMDDPIKLVLERYGPVDKRMLAELHDLLPDDSRTQGWMIDNDEMREIIINLIAPTTIGRWMRKNEDYRGQQMFLGVKAQFIDINRKFWKLFHIIWEGRNPEFESEMEIKMDMIGHLFMSMYLADPPLWQKAWADWKLTKGG
jgi:hypothetical protein